MSDELLSELGRREREAQKIPEKWRALAEGRASNAEVEGLRAAAANDPKAALLWERFRPLDASTDAAITALLLSKVKKKDSRPRRILAVLALAAAIAFAVVMYPRDSSIPAYRLEANAGDSDTRGSTAAGSILSVPVYRQGSALTLVLRPGSAVDKDVVVETYYEHGGLEERWNVPLTIAESGAIRVDGRVAELLPNMTGEVMLTFVVRNADGGEVQRLIHHMSIAAEP